MFDKSIGPSFAKVYYQRYIENPASLSTLYSENAVFSHCNVQKGLASATELVKDCYGISQINVELEAIDNKRPKTKVAILHIDSMPTGSDAVTILVGGYFLQETGPSRFVQNFILQGSEGNNNYVVVNDCLRIYEKKTHHSINSIEAPKDSEARSHGKDTVELAKGDKVSNFENSMLQQENRTAKSKTDASHDTIHESWCDEIEREEEELRQQKKKDQANLEVIDKSMSVTSIAEKEKTNDLDNVPAGGEDSIVEVKSFSYAAAAKRASSSTDDKKQVSIQSISVAKTQGADSEQAKDKKTKKSSKHEGPMRSRSPLDNASQDDKARFGKYKQRSKNFRRQEGAKKADGRSKEEGKLKEA